MEIRAQLIDFQIVASVEHSESQKLGRNIELTLCGVRHGALTICMHGALHPAKGCRGYKIDRAKTGGCDPEKFFCSNFQLLCKIKDLYIFNIHAPQCSGLNQ